MDVNGNSFRILKKKVSVSVKKYHGLGVCKVSGNQRFLYNMQEKSSKKIETEFDIKKFLQFLTKGIFGEKKIKVASFCIKVRILFSIFFT